MTTKLHTTFGIRQAAFAFLAALTLFAPAPRAPAQVDWGNALHLNGANQHVRVNGMNLANTPFTIELWAKRESSGAWDGFVGQGQPVAGLGLFFSLRDNDVGVFSFYAGGVYTADTYTDSGWHHWAATFDPATGRRIYRDGLLVASDTTTNGYTGSGPLWIGTLAWDQSANAFDGQIDDVRIWNVARSQFDIQAHMSHPLTGAEADLLAYWKFDEGTGVTAADATAHGFNATLLNGASWTESKVLQVEPGLGMALSFDGANDYLRVTNFGSAVPTNEVTVEFWQRVHQAKGQSTFALEPDQAANRFQAHVPNSDGRVFWDFGDISGAGRLYYTPPVSPVGAWQHFAFVAKAGSGGFMAIYRNGVREAYKTGAGTPYFSNHNLLLGSLPGIYFDGDLDEFRIWNVARTTNHVQETMWRSLTGTESNLVAYYRFEERAGVRTYDATPNRRHGTLLDRPLWVPSHWRPLVTLNSADPVTNECHVPFLDPTTVNAAALAVAAGNDHSLALRADGTVTGWGDNSDGNITPPANATNLVAIAAGIYHSLALKAGGTVVGWGYNWNGQASPPAGLSTAVAIAAGSYHSLALKADGTVAAWGANWFGERTVPGSAVNVVAIAAGGAHNLALKADGTVIAWGNNNSGQTTIPAEATNLVAIAAGHSFSLGLRADGTVLGWGDNYSGQTTPPASATNVVALAAGSYHSLALRADGTIVGWGENSAGQVTIPPAATNVVAMAAYGWCSLAVRADGTVINWGWAQSREAGMPVSVYQINLPLRTTTTLNTNAVGTYLSTYSTTNALGVIGTATRTIIVADRLPPVVTLRGNNPMMVNRDALFVEPGATATDLCTGDLTVQLVTNITVNTSVPGIYTNTFTVTDASGNVASPTRTVVVASPLVVTLPASNVINDTATLNGTVNPNTAETEAWFEWRSLYDHDYVNRTPAQSVGSGTNAVPISATLSGLSPGVIYHYRLAAANSAWVARGTNQSFWAPALDLHGQEFLTLEQGTPFIDPTTVNASPLALAAGPYHDLVLKADGRVVGWGWNSHGQTTSPGLATNVVAAAAGNSHSLALRADGRVVGWGDNGYGQATGVPTGSYPWASTGLVAVAGQTLTNAVAIAAGSYHSLALKADGRVVGWGNSGYGETSSPAIATNVVAVAAGDFFSLALRADGRVIGWGDNHNGQATGVPNAGATGLVAVAGQTLSNVVAISAGTTHGLALKADGTVVGWGNNDYGQTSIPAGATNVVAIAAGSDHNLVFRADGSLLAWGDNTYGQASVPASASNVVAIAARGRVVESYEGGHNLVLRADGTVIAWGESAYGQTNVAGGLTLLSLPLGVAGAVNTNVLGTYVLNYSTTNSLGAVGTATRTVVVATRPIVTTEPVTELGPTQARLQGTANPRASQTLAWFEYGLGANYGAETPKVSMGNATDAQPFGIPVSGLLPWMTYHYRGVASNYLGRTDGPDATFTLPGPVMIAPAVSALPDVTLAQGGSTSLWFNVSPATADVRVRANNPVLLPAGGLTLSGSGSSRSLMLSPDSNHSGSAQVTVTASDGTRAANATFAVTVNPAAEYYSSQLYLSDSRVVSPQAWRFRIVDAGTGSTNYTIEYRPSLSPTNDWAPATNVIALGGGVLEVGIGPPQGRTGFYRVKGLRQLLASFDSTGVTAGEGQGTAGPIVVFNGTYVGTVTCLWTDTQGTTWTNQVQVNGTTAVMPIPASLLSDNTSLGRLQTLTFALEGGMGFGLGATTQSTATIEENDSDWRGVLETAAGTLGFTLSLRQANGSAQGQIQSEGFGFFPTNSLAQLTFREATFAAVATNLCLPMLTAYPSLCFTNYVDLRLDAANSPGQTNVSATQIQGVATLAGKPPGQPHLDSAMSGTFLLLKAPTPPATNDVPLYPVP